MQLSSYLAFRGFVCLRVLFCSPFLKFIWGCFYFFKFFKTLITIKIFSPHSNRHKRKHNSADASGNACYNTTDSTEEVTKQKSAQSQSQVHATQIAKSGKNPTDRTIGKGNLRLRTLMLKGKVMPDTSSKLPKKG